MSKFKDLTGQLFGRLTVLNYDGDRYWNCKCSCPKGVMIKVRGDHLKKNKITSCGCFHSEQMSNLMKKQKYGKKQWEPIDINEHTYGIPLSRGKIALIDKEDYDKIKDYGWSALLDQGNNWYAFTMINHSTCIRMHRLLMDAPDGILVDHRDHNTLNNRKSNLRLCNDSQNGMNRRMSVNNKSGFKGVCLEKKTGKYRAQLKIDGKKIYFGSFLTPEEASQVYEKAAKELHGEFYFDPTV